MWSAARSPGHLIFGHLTTTGDGLLTALQVLKVMQETGKPLSDAGRPDDRVPAGPARRPGSRPQRLAVRPGRPAGHRPGRRPPGRSRGRLNVRASGTEKLVRVMVEGKDPLETEAIARELAALVEEKFGGTD